MPASQPERPLQQCLPVLQSAKQIEASLTQQKLVSEQRNKMFAPSGRRKESARQAEKLAELKSKIKDVEKQRALVAIELKSAREQNTVAKETLLQAKKQQRTLSVMFQTAAGEMPTRIFSNRQRRA